MTDNKAKVIAAAQALRDLGIEADAPDQSGNIPGFEDRLVLNVRGICIDEFSDWVSIELCHLEKRRPWRCDGRSPTPAFPIGCGHWNYGWERVCWRCGGKRP